MVIFPNSKINLGLQIHGKRPDGFHNLESVFLPLPLHDALEVISSHEHSNIKFTSSGLPIDTISEQNIVYKAWSLLKRDFPSMASVSVHLHKNIPMGAGLGGGSADGAFTLLLLNNKFNLGLKEEQLLRYASELGSDCPFFIINKPCLVTGRGENLERISLDLSAYSFVVIHPDIHISTKWAFSRIDPKELPGSLINIIQQPIETWRNKLFNDFEKPIFEFHPEIKNIKNELYNKGALYASMTGSGSSVYGIFQKFELPVFNFPSQYFIKSIEGSPVP